MIYAIAAYLIVGIIVAWYFKPVDGMRLHHTPLLALVAIGWPWPVVVVVVSLLTTDQADD